MNNSPKVAAPVLIALVAGGVFEARDVKRLRVLDARPAATYVAETATLTDEQQQWLDEHNPFDIPTTSTPGHRTLISREGYSLAHNNIDLVADWVAFHMTRQYVGGSETRPDKSFVQDRALSANRRASNADYDYWGQTYDRGHQVAAADLKGRSRSIVNESFILSNATPQSSRLNQRGWRLLEAEIQDIARDRGELWVITGPVFVDGDGDGIVQHYVLGKNRVSVPTHYFKIVVSERRNGEEGFETMAFLVENTAMDGEFEEYLVSIDSVETLTGYDFLASIPGEDSLEAEVADSVWVGR